MVSGTALYVACPDSESRDTKRQRGRCFPRASGRLRLCLRSRTGIPAAAVGAPVPAAAMGILEKISEIEKEIARTQKNKGKGRLGRASLSASLSFPVCKMG